MIAFPKVPLPRFLGTFWDRRRIHPRQPLRVRETEIHSSCWASGPGKRSENYWFSWFRSIHTTIEVAARFNEKSRITFRIFPSEIFNSPFHDEFYPTWETPGLVMTISKIKKGRNTMFLPFLWIYNIPLILIREVNPNGKVVRFHISKETWCRCIIVIISISSGEGTQRTRNTIVNHILILCEQGDIRPVRTPQPVTVQESKSKNIVKASRDCR